MTDQTRTYRMRRRAESQEQTRRRITESAVELHGTLGPARTTMSAIAALAGVRRSTLYRHFPDEAAVFGACSAHWSADHPMPDIAAWAEIEDSAERLRSALAELYGFYAGGAPMLENLLRDEQTSELVREHFAVFHGFLDAAREVLLAGRVLRGAQRRRTSAALGHALAFSTWKSLVAEQGLGTDAAVSLMCSLVDAAQRRDRPEAGARARRARRSAPR
jgi:AcrR family transcriptional regulator